MNGKFIQNFLTSWRVIDFEKADSVQEKPKPVYMILRVGYITS